MGIDASGGLAHVARPRVSRLAEGEPVDLLDRIRLGQNALHRAVSGVASHSLRR